jgi:hypothetical protein
MMGFPGLVSKRKKETIKHVFVLLFLYLVACAMVTCTKGLEKKIVLFFVCFFCIFSLLDCHVSIEYVSANCCVCVFVYANCLVSHHFICVVYFSWKCVVVHCGLACGGKGRESRVAIKNIRSFLSCHCCFLPSRHSISNFLVFLRLFIDGLIEFYLDSIFPRWPTRMIEN